jgi:methionyl-tRNA synthetase
MTKQEKLIENMLKRCVDYWNARDLQKCAEELWSVTDEVNDYADVKAHKKSVYVSRKLYES